jgi:hypothetical protein
MDESDSTAINAGTLVKAEFVRHGDLATCLV